MGIEKIKQINKIIEESGNNFHSKVVNSLREREWTVLISPYYNDNVSDKPREIDLIAEKAFDIRGGMFGEWKGTLNIKLFIECKYINQNIIFWFDDKERHKAEELVIYSTPMRKDNIYTMKHHYLIKDNDKVAKLFTSEKKPKADSEIIYKALNQSLNALVYYRESGTIIPSSTSKGQRILATVNYPVIICNNFDNFYRVDIGADNKPIKIKGNFQLEVNYAYIDKNKEDRSDYFLIDIINFEKIDDYFKTLEDVNDAISIFLKGWISWFNYSTILLKPIYLAINSL